MKTKHEDWGDEKIASMLGAQVRSTSAHFDQEAERFFNSLEAKDGGVKSKAPYARWVIPAAAAAMTLSLIGVYQQMQRHQNGGDLFMEELVGMDETLDLGEAVLEPGNLEVLEMLSWSVKNS
jgi:hypothetical protein